jgi:hypothetical protein
LTEEAGGLASSQISCKDAAETKFETTMRRVRPERIFLAVITPLILGGFILSAIGAFTKNHLLLKLGFAILLGGAALSSLPLVLSLIYFGWKKCRSLFGGKHKLP